MGVLYEDKCMTSKNIEEQVEWFRRGDQYSFPHHTFVPETNIRQGYLVRPVKNRIEFFRKYLRVVDLPLLITLSFMIGVAQKSQQRNSFSETEALG
jgi:hypothetical protein